MFWTRGPSAFPLRLAASPLHCMYYGSTVVFTLSPPIDCELLEGRGWVFNFLGVPYKAELLAQKCWLTDLGSNSTSDTCVTLDKSLKFP